MKKIWAFFLVLSTLLAVAGPIAQSAEETEKPKPIDLIIRVFSELSNPYHVEFDICFINQSGEDLSGVLTPLIDAEVDKLFREIKEEYSKKQAELAVRLNINLALSLVDWIPGFGAAVTLANAAYDQEKLNKEYKEEIEKASKHLFVGEVKGYVNSAILVWRSAYGTFKGDIKYRSLGENFVDLRPDYDEIANEILKNREASENEYFKNTAQSNPGFYAKDVHLATMSELEIVHYDQLNRFWGAVNTTAAFFEGAYNDMDKQPKDPRAASRADWDPEFEETWYWEGYDYPQTDVAWENYPYTDEHGGYDYEHEAIPQEDWDRLTDWQGLGCDEGYERGEAG
jgi:hypothetical protein